MRSKKEEGKLGSMNKPPGTSGFELERNGRSGRGFLNWRWDLGIVKTVVENGGSVVWGRVFLFFYCFMGGRKEGTNEGGEEMGTKEMVRESAVALLPLPNQLVHYKQLLPLV